MKNTPSKLVELHHQYGISRFQSQTFYWAHGGRSFTEAQQRTFKSSRHTALVGSGFGLLQIKHKIELNLTVNVWLTSESTNYSWACKVILSDATSRKFEREGIVQVSADTLKHCACERLHDVICHGSKKLKCPLCVLNELMCYSV